MCNWGVFQKELTVAAITDDVLLGADILHCDPEGAAELLLSKNKKVLKEETIQLLLFGTKNSTRKAYAGDHYVVKWFWTSM